MLLLGLCVAEKLGTLVEAREGRVVGARKLCTLVGDIVVRLVGSDNLI